MPDLLLIAYPWIKAFHLISVFSWMAGMFYLPRLFVYHAERAETGSELSEIFSTMEFKLLRTIMRPAMLASWFFGILLALVPGAVDWNAGWPWIKLISVLSMTGVHFWLSQQQKTFAAGQNRRSGRLFRWVNEIPTVLMVIIVIMIVVRPF